MVPASTETGGPLMVDANVLVFSCLPASPRHEAAVAALTAAEMSGAAICVSPQILRELLVQLTRRGPRSPGDPVAPAAAAGFVADLRPRLRLLPETEAVVDRLDGLLRTVGAEGESIHDANIVAAMLAHGVTRLLTHNVKDFDRYADAGLITISPL